MARSFNLLRRAFAAAQILSIVASAAVMQGSVALAQVRPPVRRPLPRGIAPPTPIYPAMPAPAVNAPVVFSWTPLTGAVAYELQISDRLDIRSRVLVDVTVFSTSYVFTNINLPSSGFTALQPAGVPLSGGPKYWRVRAIGLNSATIFSRIAAFRLGASPGMPIHDLAVAGISVAGTPIAGNPAAILINIENRGSFPEEGTFVSVFVNGKTLAQENIGPLAPGDIDTITLPWRPSTAGIATILAQLRNAGDVPPNQAATAHVPVMPQKTVYGSFRGIIGGTCGSYLLKDMRGNAIAQLLSVEGTAAPALSSFYNQDALVTGTLSVGAQGPQIAVQSITRSDGSGVSSADPCAH